MCFGLTATLGTADIERSTQLLYETYMRRAPAPHALVRFSTIIDRIT
jgi:hypothetical protein